MRVYLIGLPGVGKTTVGKSLAKELGFNYIDLDQYIEQQAMLFVDEIFMLYGEEYFRALESNCLMELSNQNNVVIACGGGIIKNEKNKALMTGPVCYLTAPLESIEERLASSSIVRPILQTKNLNDLYRERKSSYEHFADIVIENVTLDSTVQQLIEKLGDKK